MDTDTGPQIPVIQLDSEFKNDGVKTSTTFHLHNTTREQVNELRRIMYTEIPTLAVDTVWILENNSYYTNAFLDQKLKLIPVACKNVIVVDEMVPRSKCVDCIRNKNDCCEKCGIIVTLEASCNPNSGSWTLVQLTNKDLQTSSPNISFPIDQIIARIHPGQSLKMRAIVAKNYGLEHIKWSPVTSVTFKQDDHTDTSFRIYVESKGHLPLDKVIMDSYRILVQSTAVKI